MIMKEVAEYFTKGRIAYYSKTGHLLKDKEIAELIDAPTTTYSNWINTKKGKPSEKYLPKIAELFGDEIYEICDTPKPEPVLSVGAFPPSVVSALEDARLKIISSGAVGNEDGQTLCRPCAGGHCQRTPQIIACR